ncbi:MAG TPA: hypothetical protein PLL10_11290, partial [Elusimicrobiales bacterium]|nr:hypothetical protein [Elusimicrobiales bacterium]
RLGYNSRLSDARQDSSFPFSIGAGVINKLAALDYAFVPYGDLGSTHHITLTLRWGPGQSPLDILMGGDVDPMPNYGLSERERKRQVIDRQKQTREQQQQKPKPSGGVADITRWE